MGQWGDIQRNPTFQGMQIDQKHAILRKHLLMNIVPTDEFRALSPEQQEMQVDKYRQSLTVDLTKPLPLPTTPIPIGQAMQNVPPVTISPEGKAQLGGIQPIVPGASLQLPTNVDVPSFDFNIKNALVDTLPGYGERTLPAGAAIGIANAGLGIANGVTAALDLYARTTNTPSQITQTTGEMRNLVHRMQSTPSLRKSPTITEGGAFQPGNPKWWVENGSEAAAQFVLPLGLGMLGKARAVKQLAFLAPNASAVFGATYDDAMAAALGKGMSEQDAAMAAGTESLANTAGSMALDIIPGMRFLEGRVPGLTKTMQKAIHGRLVGRIATGVLAEGGTEVMQEAWGDTMKMIMREDPDAYAEWQSRYAAAGTFGGIFGGIAGSLTGSQTIRTDPVASLIDQEIIKVLPEERISPAEIQMVERIKRAGESVHVEPETEYKYTTQEELQVAAQKALATTTNLDPATQELLTSMNNEIEAMGDKHLPASFAWMPIPPEQRASLLAPLMNADPTGKVASSFRDFMKLGENGVKAALRDPELATKYMTLEEQAVARSLPDIEFSTGIQRKTFGALVLKNGLLPHKKKLVSLVSDGRTDTTKSLTDREMSRLIDLTRRKGSEIKFTIENPETANVLQTMRQNIVDVNDDISNVLKEKVGQLKAKMGPQVPIKINRFVDMSIAMADLEMQTGLPYYTMWRNINRAEREIHVQGQEQIKGLFAPVNGKKMKLTEHQMLGDYRIEQRIFDYLVGNIEATSISPDEKVIGDRLRTMYDAYAPVTRTLRHAQHMTGQEKIKQSKLPEAEFEALLQVGWELLKTDPVAYEKWINEQDFGTVGEGHYAPLRRSSANAVHILKHGLSSSHLKPRDTSEAITYNKEHGLLASAYRYIIQTERNVKTRPMLQQFEAVARESGVSNVTLSPWYKNVGYMQRGEIGILEKKWRQAASLFFQNTVAQKIVGWSLRNYGQNVFTVMPRIFSLNYTTLKNLHKLYSNPFRFKRKQHIDAQEKKYPGSKQRFHTYVSSQDAARRNFMLTNDDTWAPVSMHVVMKQLDSIGALYTGVDTYQNRGGTFSFSLDTGMELAEKFQNDPSQANLNTFLTAVGAIHSPPPVQMQIMHKLSVGDNLGAVEIAGTELSDTTQWRYPRGEKPLAFQKPGSAADLITPFFTFPRSVFQSIYYNGLKPFMDGAKAEFEGTPTETTRQAGIRGAANLMLAYGLSLIGNEILEDIWGVEDGAYSLKAMEYTPGGPVLQAMMNGLAAIYGFTNSDEDPDTKWMRVASTFDALGNGFFPLYYIFNKLGHLGDTIYRNKDELAGQATYTSKEHFGMGKELARRIQTYYAMKIGDADPREHDKVMERSFGNMMQNMLLNGGYSTPKYVVVEQWAAAMEAQTAKQRDNRIAELNKSLTKYALPPSKQDIPRKSTHLDLLISGVATGDIDKLYANIKRKQERGTPLTSDERRLLPDFIMFDKAKSALKSGETLLRKVGAESAAVKIRTDYIDKLALDIRRKIKGIDTSSDLPDNSVLKPSTRKIKGKEVKGFDIKKKDYPALVKDVTRLVELYAPAMKGNEQKQFADLFTTIGLGESVYDSEGDTLFTLTKQINGPAIGFIQVEPTTATSVLTQFNARGQDTPTLQEIHANIEEETGMDVPTLIKTIEQGGENAENVLASLPVQVLILRLKFGNEGFRGANGDRIFVPGQKMTLPHKAKVWKGQWNTKEGKGTERGFIKKVIDAGVR